MLTITKLFTILVLVCLQVQEVLWQLSKLVNNLFFEMSTQVYSLLGQAEGGRKAFLHGKSINSFHKLSLTCQRILKISKVITILAILAYQQSVPAKCSGSREYTISFQNKSVKLFFQMNVQAYSLVCQTKGERKAFFRSCKQGRKSMRVPPKALGYCK